MKIFSKSFKSDHLGIVSAAICLIHCIVTPLFFTSYVQVKTFGGNMITKSGLMHTHGYFDYIFLAIGLFAVVTSVKHTSKLWMKAMLWLSYGALFFAIVFESHSAASLWVLYGASFSLIVSHIINIRQMRHTQKMVCPTC